ncbi:MAG: hypothetical protein ACLRW2_06220 [Parasutterella excrementihominis]
MTTSALKRRSFLQGSLLAAAVIGSTPAVAAEAAKPKLMKARRDRRRQRYCRNDGRTFRRR